MALRGVGSSSTCGSPCHSHHKTTAGPRETKKNEKKDVTTVYQSAIYTLDKNKNLTKQKESSIYVSVYV